MWKEFVSRRVGSQDVLEEHGPLLVVELMSLRVSAPGNSALPHLKLKCAHSEADSTPGWPALFLPARCSFRSLYRPRG